MAALQQRVSSRERIVGWFSTGDPDTSRRCAAAQGSSEQPGVWAADRVVGSCAGATQPGLRCTGRTAVACAFSSLKLPYTTPGRAVAALLAEPIPARCHPPPPASLAAATPSSTPSTARSAPTRCTWRWTRAGRAGAWACAPLCRARCRWAGASWRASSWRWAPLASPRPALLSSLLRPAVRGLVLHSKCAAAARSGWCQTRGACAASGMGGQAGLGWERPGSFVQGTGEGGHAGLGGCSPAGAPAPSITLRPGGTR